LVYSGRPHSAPFVGRVKEALKHLYLHAGKSFGTSIYGAMKTKRIYVCSPLEHLHLQTISQMMALSVRLSATIFARVTAVSIRVAQLWPSVCNSSWTQKQMSTMIMRSLFSTICLCYKHRCVNVLYKLFCCGCSYNRGVPCLLSYPRSGNHYMRFVIEYITGELRSFLLIDAVVHASCRTDYLLKFLSGLPTAGCSSGQRVQPSLGANQVQ